MKMKYHITHEKNGIYHGLLVEARSQEIAEAYFREQKPESRLVGIHEARVEDMKPGKPLVVVPEDFMAVKIEAGAVVFAENDYLEGVVVVDSHPFPFDYNMKTEEVEVHSYSAPGWLSGFSYEKPLPAVVTSNMEEVIGVIVDAVEAFLERVNGTLESKLTSAKAVAAQREQPVSSFVKDFGI